MFNSIQNYKNIIFDFSGVLFRCDFVKFVRQAFPDSAYPEMLAEAIFGSELWFQYDKNLIPLSALRVELASLVNCESDKIDCLIAAVKEHLTPDPVSIELLRKLKKANFKIYGLTNMPKDIFDHLISIYDFLNKENIFTHITCSAHLHVAKPEQAIYQSLLNTANLKASECIFLDDRPENLTPAQTLGITPVLFKDPMQAGQALSTLLKTNLEMRSETSDLAYLTFN